MSKIKDFFSNSKENATDDTPLFIKYINMHDLYIPYWMMYAHTHNSVCASVYICDMSFGGVTCSGTVQHAGERRQSWSWREVQENRLWNIVNRVEIMQKGNFKYKRTSRH